MAEKVCRRVNGKTVCEEMSGGLFGTTTSEPRTHRPSPQSSPSQQSYPRPIQVAQPSTTVSGSYQIPPKDVIEHSQFGDVESLKCKKDRKTGRLKCKIITE